MARRKNLSRKLSSHRTGQFAVSAMVDGAQYLVKGLSGNYKKMQPGESVDQSFERMRVRIEKAAKLLSNREAGVVGHGRQATILKRLGAHKPARTVFIERKPQIQKRKLDLEATGSHIEATTPTKMR